MQPEQPIPPASGQNPYDFILAGPPKPKRSLIPSGGSLKQRVILIAGGALGLIIILYVIFGLILGGGGSTAPLVKIAQQQTEIIRISNSSAKTVRDAPISNFTQNVLLSTTSAQNQTVDYLAKHGQKLNTKRLGGLQSSKTDQALAAAQQNDQFDDTLLNILIAKLKEYKASLYEDYNNTGSKTQKALDKDLYQQTDKLLTNPPKSANQ